MENNKVNNVYIDNKVILNMMVNRLNPIYKFKHKIRMYEIIEKNKKVYVLFIQHDANEIPVVIEEDSYSGIIIKNSLDNNLSENEMLKIIYNLNITLPIKDLYTILDTTQQIGIYNGKNVIREEIKRVLNI